MNKLFIGLLIAAAGTGVFFLLRKKKSTTSNEINKEWIVGKWKVDSISPGKDPEHVIIALLDATDSAAKKEVHHFYDNGLLVSGNPYDSPIKNDSSHYEFSKNNELVFKEKASDTASTIFSIIRFTKDSLQIQTKDSTWMLLTKVK
jgi:hypothetical protein